MDQKQTLQTSWEGLHGHKGLKSWAPPYLAAESDQCNRADQGNKTLANEYLDELDVLEEKMKIIADLIKKSKCLVAYTGAGISKSSGIPDYATKAANSIVQAPKIKSSLDAQPTYSHFILTALEKAGYLKYWVQQNHDGLPQKAGFPQEKMNEIHGGWFDPSNPVVPMSGNLRGDLFDEMCKMEKKADMCLCLGTSLSSINADRMASTPANKSLKKKAIGTIIINLQQTCLDEECTIRVWSKLDDAFQILFKELQLEKFTDFVPPSWPAGDLFEIPYDKEGKLSDKVKTTFNLEVGAKIRICTDGAKNEGATGSISRVRPDNNWTVELNENERICRRVLGRWWIDAALRGAVKQLPFVNIDAVETQIINLIEEDQPTTKTTSPSTTTKSKRGRKKKNKGKI